MHLLSLPLANGPLYASCASWKMRVTAMSCARSALSTNFAMLGCRTAWLVRTCLPMSARSDLAGCDQSYLDQLSMTESKEAFDTKTRIDAQDAASGYLKDNPT